jgi:NAD(P)-dependent dehydrogenase (short-subunit alcohol dehydrogenase family)
MTESQALAGLAAIVTGAGRGVGRGIALELARAGCRVAVNYFEEPDLASRTVAEIVALGPDAFAVEADVRAGAEVTRMVEQTVARFGRLDVLVNNAGTQSWGPLLDTAEADWDRMIDTNLKGCFLCTQAAARYMKDHSGGTIINIGSGSNRMPFPNLAAYTASKGGMEMFTRVAAVELGPHAIRVNSVAPGAVEVERTQLESPEYGERWGRITPLGRVGTPADVGRAVVFLASDQGAFVTGQTIGVDGGLFVQTRWAYDEG